MDHNDFVALRAKVKIANNYLDQVMTHRGKIDTYDILKVLPSGMREHVTIVTPEIAKQDGLGYIRIKQTV